MTDTLYQIRITGRDILTYYLFFVMSVMFIAKVTFILYDLGDFVCLKMTPMLSPFSGGVLCTSFTRIVVFTGVVILLVGPPKSDR